jgi:hypothetical protein
MKKILLFIAILFSFSSFGQNRFPSIDSAKNYVLRYVKNSAVESFTNLRMQNVVYGTLQLLDSLAGAGVIDTIFISTGDTLKYKIGSTTFVVGKVGGSGDSSWVSTETGTASNKIGVLLNQNFSSGSLPANWTVGSGLSTSFTGSKLTVTGSPFWGGRAPNTYLPWGAGLQYDLYKFPYEKVSMEMTVVPTTKSAGAIIALTQASNGQSFAYKPTIAWDLSNGNTSGKVSYGLDSLVNFVSSYDSTSKISFSANDTLKLFFERDGWRTTAGILNKATGQISYIPFNTVNLYGQGGKWNWIFLNGTYVVTNVKVTVNESEGGVLFAGHSRVAGFGATDETKRYSNLVFNSNYKYFKNVGLPSVSARYFDENGLTDEISTVLKPNKVVFDIGGNDLVDWGGTPAQINVYIDSIGQTFQRNGATDITFVGQFPSSANANILNDSIAALSLRRGWNYVDVDTTIQRDATIIVGQYNYDGAHYSDSGNIIIAGKILAKRGANLLAQMYADTNYTAKFYNFQSLQNAPINILGVKADGTTGLWPNTLPKPNQYIENRYSTAANTSPNSVAQKETAIHVSSYIKSDSVLWVNSSQGLKMSFADFNSSNTTRSNINITAAHVLVGNIGTMAFDNITGAGNIKIIAPSANKTKGNITGTISGNNNTVFNSNLGTGTLSGSDNIGIGNYSTGLTSGSGNIGIGATSLIGLTTGSRNIAIQISDGINNSYSSNNVSNTIIIGHGGAESITNGDIALGLPPYLGTPNMWIGGRTNYMTEVLMNAAGVVGTNTNGVPFRIRSSRGTGSGKGGSIIFQTWNAGASGTTINSTANTELTIENDSVTVDAGVRVNGNLRIVNGSQGTGKVLTSDANGVATWETATGGGISDTSRIVTTDKTQSITGRKTFNAATFINKDSLPITTGRRWAVVVDTTNNRLSRQDLNIYRRDLDTIPLATFTVGSAAAGDTAAFSTSTLAGSFYLDGTDTLFVTSYRVALQGTTPSITPEVWFNDSLNVTAGGTRLATGSAITNTTTGTSVTATTNKIPQGNFVFVRFSAVATKPTYFTLTLFGYRIRKA